MTIDSYIFQVFVFSPLVAAVFITLIPAADTSSKLAVSRFFALVGFLAFTRVFVVFLNSTISADTFIAFGFLNIRINLFLHLSKYNLLLYGAASLALLANMFAYEIKDVRSNVHQVSPFVLIFFLYISLGQVDLRIALPILSIANFLIYFLIANGQKTRRGATIFHTGIFLFSCDVLALVLLQIKSPANASANMSALLNLLLLVPGLARLSMPMLAPFMKKLLINVDDEEGPLIIIFLQLSGFLTLLLVRNEIPVISDQFIALLSLMSLIGVIYLALISVSNHQVSTLPYYLLIFYSSLVAILLFVSKTDKLWHVSLSLFLTNIACFFSVTFFANQLKKLTPFEQTATRYRATWFFMLALLIGVPGLGIGTSLWAAIYQVMRSEFFTTLNFWWLITGAWLIAQFILLLAVIMSVRKVLPYKTELNEVEITTTKATTIHSLIRGPLLITAVSWLIPIVTYYVSTKGR